MIYKSREPRAMIHSSHTQKPFEQEKGLTRKLPYAKSTSTSKAFPDAACTSWLLLSCSLSIMCKQMPVPRYNRIARTHTHTLAHRMPRVMRPYCSDINAYIENLATFLPIQNADGIGKG